MAPQDLRGCESRDAPANPEAFEDRLTVRDELLQAVVGHAGTFRANSGGLRFKHLNVTLGDGDVPIGDGDGIKSNGRGRGTHDGLV